MAIENTHIVVCAWTRLSLMAAALDLPTVAKSQSSLLRYLTWVPCSFGMVIPMQHFIVSKKLTERSIV